MIVRALPLLIAGLAASGAIAETVSVRSGEHEGFSRLVLEFRERPDWSLDRTDGGYELRLDQREVTFDLADVFRLIPRTRIADIAQQGPGGTLQVELGCDCHAEAFEFREAAIVVDIRDGPALPKQDVVEGAFPIQPSSAAFGADGPKPATAASARDALAIVLPQPWNTPGSMPPQRRLPVLASAGAAPTVLTDGDPVAALNIAHAGGESDLPLPGPFAVRTAPGSAVEAIAQELARASALGLVTVDRDPAPPRPFSASVVDDDTLEPQATVPDEPNLRIETSIARDIAGLSITWPGGKHVSGCLSDDVIAVGNWGEEQRIGRQIGIFRGALAEEFDRPDPTSIKALARHYVFLSFGAEAAGLLKAYPGLVDTEGVLLALAAIMDAGTSDGNSPLDAQATCPSDVALWSFLSDPDQDLPEPLASESILSAFSRLPLHLRRHLGPHLVDALRAQGFDEDAGQVLAAVVRAPGDHGAALELAAAQAESKLRPASVPDETYRPLLAADQPQAARAALAILEAKIASGPPVDQAAITDAAAFAFEFANLPLGQALKRAEVEGLILNMEFNEARAVLNDAVRSGQIEAPDRTNLLTQLLAVATARASDGRFVMTTLSLGAGLPDDSATRQVRRDIATRLAGLGLPDLARDFSTEAMPDDEFVKAASGGSPSALLERSDSGTPATGVSGLASRDDPPSDPGSLAQLLTESRRLRDEGDAILRAAAD